MKKLPQPPRWADHFLEWYCRPELLEEIQGDIYELFAMRAKEKSLAQARRRFVWDVLRSFRLSTIKHIKFNHNTMMFSNHLKIAFRMLQKKKGFALLNISGIAISLTFALLMLLWVQDELSVNKFHENGDRIYHLSMGFIDADGQIDVSPIVSYQLSQAAKKELPYVENGAAFSYNMEKVLSYKDQQFKVEGVYGDKGVFEIFNFPLLLGSIKETFKHTQSLAISKNLAQRLFGETDWQQALGKSLQLENGKSLKVGSIYANIPENSTLKFDFVIHVEDWLNSDEELAAHWGYHAFSAYVLLRSDADASQLQEDVTEIYANSEVYDEGEMVVTQAIVDEYLYSRFDKQGKVVGGRIEYVQIFFWASIFLLLIAGINFINLATARASQRAKEVSLRKVVGAKRGSLISQFLTEAGLITMISIVLALGLAELSLPYVRSLTGKNLYFNYLSAEYWLFLGFIFLGMTLFSGIYPSFILSSFKITNVLKRNFGKGLGSNHFRRGLVILQFVLSLVLIVGAVVVRQQIHYIKNKNLGLDRSNVIYMRMASKAQDNYKVIRDKLTQKPGIEAITSTSHNPMLVSNESNGVDWPAKDDSHDHIHFNILYAEQNFEKVFKIPLAEGRYFQKDMKSDPEKAVIINEKAAEVMGLKKPLGTNLQVEGERQIIGVVKNFHMNTLYEDINPMVILPEQGFNWSMFVRTKKGKTQEAIKSLEAVFEEIIPSSPLVYEFLDDYHNNRYKSELLTGTLANYFALFSIFISCLGLYGLVSFLAEQKTKEIAIRKVLGASVWQIITLLSRNFLTLVSIGLVIGAPLAWYFTQNWLQKFAYHIDLQAWMFVIPTFLAVLIAAFTVGYQGIRAAWKNPVNSLRED